MEPATFRLVAQCLNQLSYHVFPFIRQGSLKLFLFLNQKGPASQRNSGISDLNIFSLQKVNSNVYIVYNIREMSLGNSTLYRSQWPRGLRHELSSLARTLGSWVPIPLDA
jgi:hypothetical protein